jgi:hypothetical protein
MSASKDECSQSFFSWGIDSSGSVLWNMIEGLTRVETQNKGKMNYKWMLERNRKKDSVVN